MNVFRKIRKPSIGQRLQQTALLPPNLAEALGPRLSVVTGRGEQNFLSPAFISAARTLTIAAFATDAMQWRG